jgi:NAD(P)H-dependent FMN reductase
VTEIQIIVGSTRPGRLGLPISKWLHKEIDSLDISDVNFEIVDLSDYNLPLLDESNLPAMQKYENDHSKKWSETIARADGYIIVTPEYNHSVPGAVKNAIDFLFNEWKYKPMAFVGYGSVGGVRSIEQLVNAAVGVNAFPLRDQMHICEPWAAIDEEGNVKSENIKGDLRVLVDNLVLVANGTKDLRS